MLKQVVLAGAFAGVGSADATQIGRVGLESCGAWTQTRQMKTPVRLLMEQWITGWLDRANFKLDPDILEGEDWLGVMAWIDKYCAAHPLDKLSTAVGALEQELMARHPAQSKSKSEEKHKAGARTKLRIGAQPFHFRLSVLAQGTDVGADLKLNRPQTLALDQNEQLRHRSKWHL